MPTQERTTRHGCVAHARVQRANPPVASRSWAARRSGVVLSAIAVAPFRGVGLHVRRAGTPEFIVHRFVTLRGTPSRYSTTTVTPSSRARSGSSRATRNAAGGAEVA